MRDSELLTRLAACVSWRASFCECVLANTLLRICLDMSDLARVCLRVSSCAFLLAKVSVGQDFDSACNTACTRMPFWACAFGARASLARAVLRVPFRARVSCACLFANDLRAWVLCACLFCACLFARAFLRVPFHARAVSRAFLLDARAARAAQLFPLPQLIHSTC